MPTTTPSRRRLQALVYDIRQLAIADQARSEARRESDSIREQAEACILQGRAEAFHRAADELSLLLSIGTTETRDHVRIVEPQAVAS
jgi:F0F1-type ATP synthase membrane subunit b/b'